MRVKKVIEAIRNLKPYAGGDEILYGIHTLNISDKHKLIIPIANIAFLRAKDAQAIDPDIPFYGEGNLMFPYRETGVLIIIELNFINRKARRSAPHFEYDTKIQPVFTIGFSDGQMFEGTNAIVMTTLLKMATKVEDAINLIEAAM